jgi:hypothetical protein
MTGEVQVMEGTVMISCNMPLLHLCSWFGELFSWKRESLTFEWFSCGPRAKPVKKLKLKETAKILSVDCVPWSMSLLRQL